MTNDQVENITEDKVDNNNLELTKLTWDEYKYRHELCWNLIFKITLVTAALSIIPYLNNDIIQQAKRLVFFTPLIGIAISTIGGIRLYRELIILNKIRKLHRDFQNSIYKKKIHHLKRSRFTLHVTAYIILLTCLAVLNFIIILRYVY